MSAAAPRLTELIAPVFYAPHRAIRHGTHGELWLKGGRGSGKSSFISLEIAMGMMRDPQANAIVYRKIADTLRDSVYAQIIWALDMLGVASKWICRLSPMEMIYRPTGQRILFRGADDPQKSKGIKLTQGFFKFVWFEELSEFHGQQDMDTILASVIRGSAATVFASYNPPMMASNWVNQAALKERQGRLVHSSTYLDLSAQWLGREFILRAEALRDGNQRAYRHMYLGEITGAGGQVFENVRLRAIPQEERASFDRIHMGVDWGWYPDPFQWVKTHYDAARRTLYLFDELRAWKTSNQETARQLMEQHGVTGDDDITADSAEKKSVQDYYEIGLRCRAAHKGPGSVEYSMKWLQSLAEIVIDPETCPYAAEEFSTYEYEKDKSGTVVSGYPDRDNHAIDAVRYALERIWRRRGQ